VKEVGSVVRYDLNGWQNTGDNCTEREWFVGRLVDVDRSKEVTYCCRRDLRCLMESSTTLLTIRTDKIVLA
jgi:hypothetical protein